MQDYGHPVPSSNDKQKKEKWKQGQISSLGALKSLWMVTAAMKLEDDCSWQESYDKPRQHFKKQRHRFANKRSI